MTSEPVIMTPDATVAEALARIREPQLSPVVAAQVFVARAPMATPTGKYLGMVHFQRLLREPPSTILGGVVDSDIDPLRPETDLTEITRRMATYDLVAMPVVDATHRLVGAVSVDDVLDHLLPRDWRDRDTQATDAQDIDIRAAETQAADNLFAKAEAARGEAAHNVATHRDATHRDATHGNASRGGTADKDRT
jgi:Mg/Co/Ni transporter MgtE